MEASPHLSQLLPDRSQPGQRWRRLSLRAGVLRDADARAPHELGRVEGSIPLNLRQRDAEGGGGGCVRRRGSEAHAVDGARGAGHALGWKGRERQEGSERNVLLLRTGGGNHVLGKAGISQMTTRQPASSCSRIPRLVASALALCCVCHGARAHADVCSPESVGIDTSHGNTYFVVFMGSARGQVFEARDTVLQAVTVWREPSPNDTALRLYVLELDSTGMPDYARILLYGPTLQILYGDGVHPIRFRYVLDPPLVLPGPGHYEFAIQVAPPSCDGATSLFGDTAAPYPE